MQNKTITFAKKNDYTIKRSPVVLQERAEKDAQTITRIRQSTDDIGDIVSANMTSILHEKKNGNSVTLDVSKMIVRKVRMQIKDMGKQEDENGVEISSEDQFRKAMKAYSNAVHGMYRQNRKTGEVSYDRNLFERNGVELPFIALQRRFALLGVKVLSFTDGPRLVVMASRMDYDFKEEGKRLPHGLNKLPTRP